MNIYSGPRGLHVYRVPPYYIISAHHRYAWSVLFLNGFLDTARGGRQASRPTGLNMSTNWLHV